MGRPGDSEYFVQFRTEHVAQGDIFADAVEFDDSIEPYTTNGMLLNYTSGMMIGREGTRGYRHPFRLIAPIVPFPVLLDLGLTQEQLKQIQTGDMDPKYMYLPPYPDAWTEESAVLCYRPVLRMQSDLDNVERLAQLEFPAAQQIQRKLLRMFIGRDFRENVPPEPEDDPPSPDMTDHWNP